MSDNKKTTIAQDELVAELVETYGLSPEQIGFERENIEPILDFEALCTMREKLTDFNSIDVSQVTANEAGTEASAICVIVTAKDRTITVSDFAKYGEIMPDGSMLQNSIHLKGVARARAMRSGIRAAGVNLLKAHRHFMETGDTLNFTPVDPRINSYKEIHALASEIGFIVGENKEEYQKHIGQMFDGRTSSKDLNDIELGQLRISLRAIRRVLNSKIAATEKVAA